VAGVEAVPGDVVGPAAPDGQRVERGGLAAGLLPEDEHGGGDAPTGGAVGAVVFEVDRGAGAVVLADAADALGAARAR